MTITRENLAKTWQERKAAIEASDRKLSPNRSGELAAADIVVEVRRALREIDAHISEDTVTEAECAYYDAIYVDGWNPNADVIRLSGTRTLLLDIDDIDRTNR